MHRNNYVNQSGLMEKKRHFVSFAYFLDIVLVNLSDF